jgi:hypothetical protein
LICRQFIEAIASGANGNSYAWEDEAIAVGRMIMAEFRKDAETSKAVHQAIVETFSLMAYSKPWIEAPTKHLLLPNMREPVATLVDKAVLGALGVRKESSLEMAVRHSLVLSRALAGDEGSGISGSGLLNVEKYLELR